MSARARALTAAVIGLAAAGVLTVAVALVHAGHRPPVEPVTLATSPPAATGSPNPSPSSALNLNAGDPLVTPGPGELLTWAVADVATGNLLAISDDAATITSTTESVIKTWIAADYLATHPTIDTAKLAEISRAIRDSDDTAAQDLYQADGGDLAIARASTACAISAGIYHNRWARTELTAANVARLGVCLADGRAAGDTWTPWLLDQMRGVRGAITDQHPDHGGGRWGIIEAPGLAGHDVAIKNGWTRYPDGWHVNCLAIIDGQWTLAVLTRYPAALGLAHGAAECAAVARKLTPATAGQPAATSPA